MVDYKRTFSQGNAAETALAMFLRKHGWTVERLDYTKYTADLRVTKGTEIHFLEVKSHYNERRFSTFPAEVWQNATEKYTNIRPEYLRANCIADIKVEIDMITNQAYFYNRKKQAEYVLANENKARPAKNTFSAEVLLIPWECEEAGWIKTANIRGK